MMREKAPHIRGKPPGSPADGFNPRPGRTAASPREGECKPPPLSFRVVRAQVKGGIRGPDPPD